ncbi:MAG: YgeY family selenium metabolism-linked hydrolase [Spirochaetaceae bacterium]|nr:MAG: YgeY family selenium metabolism-linked hydrolase [Spirochaetaceae bacterium]
MEPNLLKSIQSTVESSKEELANLLQRLIRIRSYSGEEKEIVEHILDTMQYYGFDEQYSDGLGNAVGRIGDGPVTILYDAHIDTVQVTDEESWVYPPFEGRIVDGTIYGRGAVDEKSAMAGFLMAGKVLKALHPEGGLPFSIYMVGSVMEEDCDGYPLRHLIEQEGLRPDYVLLGEPTDLRVFRGQRGRMEMEIITTGKSAHGAHNRQGINAIYKMNPLVRAIEKLDRCLAAVQPLGRGSITVSDIRSRGPSLCSVPDHCRIHIDRRLTVGETREIALAQLEEIVQKNGGDAMITVPEFAGTSWKTTKFSQEAYFPTWIMEEEHPLVQAGLETARMVLGRKARSGFWSFSTNGVATAGRHDLPTIGFAPGKEELAHSSREEIVLSDLIKATEFYALFPFVLT